MLPLKLKMSAFCSYRNETEIDFEKFGRKGLYLISGKIGTGKTTIFDAITYVLYGRASGDLRKAGMLRSQNADPDQPTFVELTFLSKGKKYRVRRNPEYQRPAKRGNGTTSEPAKMTLYYYDGDTVVRERPLSLRSKGAKGRSEAEEVIEEIIGIDDKKFSQLSMIAQGSFTKLLNAGTEEKNEILRTIFLTKQYRDIENRLSEISDKYRRACEELEMVFLTKLQIVSCADDSVYCEKLSEIKKRNSVGIISGEECVEIMSCLIDEDEKRENALRKLIGDSSAQLGEINTRIGMLTQLEETRKRYIGLCSVIEKDEEQLPGLEAEFEAVRDNESRAEICSSEAAALESRLPDYDKYTELIKSLSAVEKDIASASDGIEKKRDEVNRSSRDIEEMTAELEALRNTDAELERIKAVIDSKEKRLDEYRSVLKAFKAYGEELAKLEKAKDNYIAASDRSKRSNLRYNELNQAFLDDQAGIIAERLDEGRPCPVCGSLTHPHKAEKKENAPDEQQVKEAKEQAEKDAREAAECSSLCAAVNASLENQRGSVTERGKELFGREIRFEDLKKEVTDAGIALAEEKKRDQSVKKELESRSERKAEIEKSIPVFRSRQEQARAGLEELNRNMSAFVQKKAGLAEHKASLAGTLPFAEKKDALNRISALRKESADLKNSYRKADEALRNCRTRLEQNRLHRDSFKEVSSEPFEKEIEALRAQADGISADNKVRNEACSAITARRNNNSEVRSYFEKTLQKLEESKRLRDTSRDLSMTANANLSSKEHDKLTLETYVQVGYFEDVLKFANKRLEKMSGGKYTFKRSSAKGRRRTGLDINVLNRNSGADIPSVSLSGGESFMASLSLALGFSDVIQLVSGGVSLDTMFIDEGFGTLDDDILENAYSVLSDLSLDSNCLIGIISHIEGLSSKIDKRIVVSKDASGNSRASVEV